MTITAAKFQVQIGSTIVSGANARHSFAQTFSHTLKDSGGDYLFDRVFSLKDYSLTTGAGNLDIDLYDLGTLDLGAGAGEDNLGLVHANARIVAMAIRNKVIASGGTLRIDNNGASTTSWDGIFHTSTVLDLAQGAFFSAYLGESGKTVTDTTDHILRLSAQSNNCEIDVVFFSKQS